MSGVIVTRISCIALLVTTASFLYLSGRIIEPFTAPIVWAIALAIIVHPLFSRTERWINRPSIAAAIVVFLIGTLLAIPTVWVSRELVIAALQGIGAVIPTTMHDTWLEIARRYPRLDALARSLEESLHFSDLIREFTTTFGYRTTRLVALCGWSVLESILTLFIVFFLLRDSGRFLDTTRALIPLSEHHTSRVFERIADTIHATLFGMVSVAVVQGFLGGLLIWWLELPGAIIWGTIMGLLALVPYLGAFVVWIPLAAFLAVKVDWGIAVVTVLWGTFVIGLIDNLLYPFLVGKRMHYHSLVVFFFLLGGVVVFGAAGVVLGPAVLAITDCLIQVWREEAAREEASGS